MRHLNLVAVAGRPGRRRHRRQAGQNAVGLNPAEADAEGVGQPLAGVAVDSRIHPGSQQSALQPVTHRLHVAGVSAEVLADQFAGFPQPGHLDDVLRPRPAVLLVVGSVHQFFQPDAGADVQSADPLGGVQLVPCDGKQVNSQLVHAHRDLPHRLGAVAVHQRAVTVSNLGNLRDGLYRPDLVVGVHYADQQCLGSDSILDLPRVNQSVFVYRQIAYPKPLGFQVAAHLGNRRMLDSRRNDMAAAFPIRPGHALDGVVVGLRAAAGENQVIIRAAQHPGHLSAGQVNPLPRRQAEGVPAGWVAEEPVNVGKHGLGNLRVNGGGGVVVKVNACHRRLQSGEAFGLSLTETLKCNCPCLSELPGLRLAAS